MILSQLERCKKITLQQACCVLETAPYPEQLSRMLSAPAPSSSMELFEARQSAGILGLIHMEPDFRRAQIVVEPFVPAETGNLRASIYWLLYYAFHVKKLHKLYAITPEENDPVHEFWQSFGFVWEARLRDFFPTGRDWGNGLACSMLRHEFERQFGHIRSMNELRLGS